MKTTIESFSDYKTNQYGPSAKVKLGTGDQVFINEQPEPLIGKTVDIEITDKPNKAGTRTYKIGKISKVYEQSTATATNSNGNNNGAGKITWDAYRAMAEAAHSLAMKLEPDEIDVSEATGHETVRTDRGSARAAILNTVMIAYSNGKIFVPEDDDDQIPPF
jgi:flagellar hook assembly protein FlgD